MAYIAQEIRRSRGLDLVGWMVGRWLVDSNTGLSTIRVPEHTCVCRESCPAAVSPRHRASCN